MYHFQFIPITYKLRESSVHGQSSVESRSGNAARRYTDDELRHQCTAVLPRAAVRDGVALCACGCACGCTCGKVEGRGAVARPHSTVWREQHRVKRGGRACARKAKTRRSSTARWPNSSACAENGPTAGPGRGRKGCQAGSQYGPLGGGRTRRTRREWSGAGSGQRRKSKERKNKLTEERALLQRRRRGAVGCKVRWE